MRPTVDEDTADRLTELVVANIGNETLARNLPFDKQLSIALDEYDKMRTKQERQIQSNREPELQVNTAQPSSQLGSQRSNFSLK
jgi:hypothetical protein